MPLFTRRPALPTDVRNRLALAHGDRVLTAAARDGGGWAVASREALHLVTGDGADAAVEPHPWADVDRGSFDPDTSSFTIHWVTGTSDVLRLAPPVPRAFAQTFRERVQSSVVHVETVRVPGAGPVRVALRRGGGGALFTQVIGTARVRLDDPEVARVVDEAERRVRSAAGLRD